VQLVELVQQVAQGQQVELEQLVELVLQVQQVQLDLQVLKETRDQLVRRVQLVLTAQ
jgi:hypothetical protein